MKTLLFISALLISISTLSQPFISLGATNRGIEFQFGILAAPIEFTIIKLQSLLKNNAPSVLSVSLGKQFLLTRNEQDNYSVTPAIGIAQYKVKDYGPYNADPLGNTEPLIIADLKAYYRIELGKDSYMGRVFISATYCKGMIYGIGLKMFPYR